MPKGTKKSAGAKKRATQRTQRRRSTRGRGRPRTETEASTSARGTGSSTTTVQATGPESVSSMSLQELLAGDESGAPYHVVS